jgi:sigma-B regulation protein RsbU (phosphoserine phosphatase)
VFEGHTNTEPVPYNRWPPGIPPRAPDVEGAVLRAGLYLPLWAQDEQVGLLIVHSTQKTHFEPGEIALLQTFANQAAIAIERAGLIEQLRTKINELEAAQTQLARKERMERELELARQVQQSMLPHTFPQVPSFQFAARYESARQVGGDFYDVITLDSQYFGVAVADVSDKGMPAALYMALTRSLLLAEARREQSPSAVLANVNHLLLELGEPNMFVTIFYGVIEQATGRLTYARAGHDRPLLLRDSSIQELAGRGLALGLFDTDELRLSDEQIRLSSGDRLVLYSDGLTDVSNRDGQLFDLARFKTLLQSYATLTPNDLCTAIFGYLSTYQSGTEHYDDMTLLVVGVD